MKYLSQVGVDILINEVLSRLDEKQNVLNAGDNITISNNIISAQDTIVDISGKADKTYVDENIPQTGITLPTPSATYRGKIFTLLDNVNGDTAYVCLRDKNGNYSWQDIVGVFT